MSSNKFGKGYIYQKKPVPIEQFMTHLVSPRDDRVNLFESIDGIEYTLEGPKSKPDVEFNLIPFSVSRCVTIPVDTKEEDSPLLWMSNDIYYVTGVCSITQGDEIISDSAKFDAMLDLKECEGVIEFFREEH